MAHYSAVKLPDDILLDMPNRIKVCIDRSGIWAGLEGLETHEVIPITHLATRVKYAD